MATGLTQAVVIDGLRRWARGAYAEEAAVELLVRAFGGRYASTVIGGYGQCDRPGWFWLDGERLSNATPFRAACGQRVWARASDGGGQSLLYRG